MDVTIGSLKRLDQLMAGQDTDAVAITGGTLTGVTVTADLTVTAGTALQLSSFTVATVPAASANTGAVIYVTDGDTGSPCIAVSNGTNWLRIALGTAIAAS